MSWQRIDLLTAAANPPAPPTIGGLLYPGKRTLLSGPMEALKTWCALILTKEELDAGYAVAWADLDATGSGELLARLRALGVPDNLIRSGFFLYEPDSALQGAALDEFVAEVAEAQARLFVVDAFNSMLGLHDLDMNKTADVETFWREVAQPICDAGLAVTPIDHVVKNAEARGGYSIGSERKASGAHLHIGFHPLTPLSRGGTGRTRLTTNRDKGGYLPRPTLGVLELVSAGCNVAYSLQQDRSRSGDKFRPTFLMEKVSEYLESCDEPVALNAVEGNVPGKAEAKRTAIGVLVDEGFASEEKGPRGARMFESVRPYREDEDDLEPGDDSTSSPPRPDLVPTLRSTPSARPRPSSPPLRGDEDEDGLRPRPATSSPSPTPSRGSNQNNGSESTDEYELRTLGEFYWPEGAE